LGKGVGSCVRRALYSQGGNEYVFAIKSTDAADSDKRKQLLNDLREYLTGVYCEYVIEFYCCFFKDGMVKMVLEYMDMGSLKNVIDLVREGKLQLS
jgi:mitogen-activated protein kinase kinase 2